MDSAFFTLLHATNFTYPTLIESLHIMHFSLTCKPHCNKKTYWKTQEQENSGPSWAHT